MGELTHAQFKVLIAICRKTIGWHKHSDYISISQIVELANVSNKTVVSALKQLEEMGYITTQKSSHRTTLITINYQDSTSVVSTPTSVTSTQGSVMSTQVTSVMSTHTKETIKETIYKYSEFVDLWNECNGTKLRITDGKRNQIKARFKKFTEAEIESAIKARGSTKWVKENNQSNNWDAVFKSDDALEHWLLRSDEQSPEKDAWAKDGWKTAVL